MGLLLIGAGLGLVCLPAALRSLGRRLAPPTWARLCLAALIAGAGSVGCGLVLYAAPTVLLALGVPGLATACERMLGGVAPGGAAAGWVAGSAALALGAQGAVGLVGSRRVRRRCRVESGLGQHRPLGSHELVILPSAQPIALCVDGRPGQVVVTEGLAAALGPAEMAAVLAHESAHLDSGHERYLTAAGFVASAFCWFAPARASVAVLRLGLERAADEAAASQITGGRQVLRAALVRTVATALGTPVAAFSAADTVAERLEALESPPPPAGLASLGLLYTPGIALGTASVAGLAAWSGYLHMLVVMAGRCPL